MAAPKVRDVADRRRILLVCSRYARFVRTDHDILAERYDVERFRLEWRPGLLARLRGTHGGLAAAIRRADLVYWWFMSDYAALGTLLSRVTRTPFIGVAGGWDVAYEPEADYGRLAVSPRASRTATRAALRLADLILTVSPMNDAEALKAGRRRDRLLVPNGVDTERVRPDPRVTAAAEGARPMVVAIGAIKDSNVHIKGQGTFADVSRLVPEADFVLVGRQEPDVAERLLRRGGKNLKLPGFVPDDVLLRMLQAAKVACQLSWHESFGMGIAEATSCGCVPVYSSERIGCAAYLEDLGRTTPFGDAESAAGAVRAALKDADVPGYRDRAHAVVKRNVPLSRRRSTLHDVVASFLD